MPAKIGTHVYGVNPATRVAPGQTYSTKGPTYGRYLPGITRTIGQSTAAYQRANFRPFSMITGTTGGGIQTKEGVARSFSVDLSPRKRIILKKPKLYKPTQTFIGQAQFKRFHTPNILGPRITTQGHGVVDETKFLSDNKVRETSPLFKTKKTVSRARLTGRTPLGGVRI